MSDKMRESAIALMEAAMIAGVDEYFAARPQLMRTRHEECLYEAGFKRAWQAAHDAALPPGFVAVPVEPTHEMLEAMREKHWEIRGCQLCAHDYRDVHAAMLAARPEVK